MEQAIEENAIGLEDENIIVNADAAESEDESRMAREEAGNNDIIPQGVVYSCMDENCNVKTSNCSQEEIACQLLMMHMDLKHKIKEEAGKSKVVKGTSMVIVRFTSYVSWDPSFRQLIP